MVTNFNFDNITGRFVRGDQSIEFQGKKNGKIFIKDIMIYEGNLKKFIPHGHGKSYDNVGIRYDGNFKNGKKHGKGIVFYANGKPFLSGTWKDGKRDGKFSKHLPDGTIASFIKFKNDKEIECPDGKILNPKTGNCINMKNTTPKRKTPERATPKPRTVKHKQTVEYRKNPETGEYENNNIRVQFISKNKGKIYVKNKIYYDGELKNFKANGFGTFFSEKDEKPFYIGHNKNGVNHGKGKFVDKNGNPTIEGTWKDGKLNGKVKFTLEDGSVNIVPFKDDEMVKCPDGKELNTKTGNCVKKKGSISNKDAEYIKTIYKTVIDKYFEKKVNLEDWHVYDHDDNPIELLLSFFENSNVTFLKNMERMNEKEKVDALQTIVKNANAESAKRVEKGFKHLTFRDLGEIAEKLQFWIFLYENEMERWNIPPASFYNYKPKAIVFLTFEDDGEFQCYSYMYPKKILASIKPLCLDFEKIRKTNKLLQMRYPTEIYQKNLKRHHSIEKQLEQISLNPRPPQTPEEKELIQLLKQTTSLDDFLYSHFSLLLKPFLEKYKCWIYMYHSKTDSNFYALTLEEIPERMFFVHKKSTCSTKISTWTPNEFEMTCRLGPNQDQNITSYIPVCERRVIKTKEPKKRKPRTGMDKLKKIFKKRRT